MASHDVIVDAATQPTSLDRAGRFFFRRAKQPTQKAINDSWSISGGTRNYLGEWHTHPELSPTPSPHDREDWRRISMQATFEQDFLLFLIVGQKSMALWEVCPTLGLEAKCELLEGA